MVGHLTKHYDDVNDFLVLVNHQEMGARGNSFACAPGRKRLDFVAVAAPPKNQHGPAAVNPAKNERRFGLIQPTMLRLRPAPLPP